MRSPQSSTLRFQGLFVCGTPHMTILAFSSADVNINILAVADIMEEKGTTIIVNLILT